MHHLFPIPILGPPENETQEDASRFYNSRQPPQSLHYPGDRETDEYYALINNVLESDEFANAADYREQVGILCKTLREELDPPLSYERIGTIFSPPKSPAAIREQYLKYKNGVLQNGRPPLLSSEEILELEKNIEKHISEEGFPTYEDISDLIITLFNKYIALPSVRSLVHRLESFKAISAMPIEQARFKCPQEKIEEYYKQLADSLVGVPVGWLFNLDETGQQDFVDSHQIRVVVPKDFKNDKAVYPVDRNGKRCTALHCICSDGQFLKPLFILPRKTVDLELYDELSPDDVVLLDSPTGFINTEIFCSWFDEVFIKYVSDKRKATGYEGNAVLIMDGFIAHHKCVEDPKRKAILEQEKIVVIFIPPHSSDQVQPLDLLTFSLQKLWKKRAQFYSVSYQTRQVLETYNSLCMASTPHYVKAAFERAGITRTRLEIINGERQPQYHRVSIKENNAIREAVFNRSQKNENESPNIDKLYKKLSETHYQRKSAPIKLLYAKYYNSQ